MAPSGGDNHRPDVAKVQTLPGNAGYVGIRDGGPNDYSSEMLDSAIRQFQQDKGLKVDGVLKPGGPTITALGRLLDRPAQPNAKPNSQNGLFDEFNGGTNSIAQGEWDWMDKDKRAPDWPLKSPDMPKPVPQPGDLDISGDLLGILTGERPFPTTWPQPTDTSTTKPSAQPQPQGQPKLVRGQHTGMISEIPNDPNEYEWFLEYPDGTRVPTDPPPREPVGRTKPIAPYPDHTISEDGVFEHHKYAKNLVRDSNPHETARYLKNVISCNGDTGRGDVADLLGRFAKVDEAKAKVLQDALHQASGERIPFRMAPLGEDASGAMADLAEGGAPSASANPFGSTDGADRWEAGNMARALLGRSDYQDAITHFRGEIAKDRAATMPYLAAVHQEMSAKNPELAGKFAGQMGEAGLAQAAGVSGQAPEGTVSGSGTKDDPWVSGGGTKVWRENDGAWHVGDIRPLGTETDDGTSIGVESPSESNKPVFEPRYGDGKTPPEWKRDVLKRQPGAWETFNGSVEKLPGATDTEKFVYGQIFAAEGGNDVDKESGASSGITKGILAEVKASGKIPGLDKVHSPKDLNADQRAAIMQSYFDQRFRHIGGAKMLDWVGDKVAAGSLADTVYRHGASGGMKMVQRAINQVNGKTVVDVDGGMGAQTFNEFQRLVNDPKTRDQLLNKIADLKDSELNGAEKDRTDHYRPR